MAVTLPSMPRARDLRAALPTLAVGADARAPALARRVSRDHRRRDAARQRSRHLGSDLSAARARGVERLDADRPHLPVLPLHRRHHDVPLAQRASRPRRRRARDPRADHPARSADLPVRPPDQRLPLLHLGRRRRASPTRRFSSASSTGCCTGASLGVLQRIGIAYMVRRAAHAADDRSRSRSSSSPALLFGYWIVMTVLPVPGEGTIGALAARRRRRARWPRGSTGSCSTGVALRPRQSPLGLERDLGSGRACSRPFRRSARRCSATSPAGGSASGARSPSGSPDCSPSGALGMMVGLMWNWSFPINKSLWTSSYVLFTAGHGRASRSRR